MNQNEALASVNEAFVNYNRLAGRDRQYIESIGLMWFYNFKIRIMKEAVYTLRNHPIRSLLIWGAPIGSPISDNLATVAMEDRLGLLARPGHGVECPKPQSLVQPDTMKLSGKLRGGRAIDLEGLAHPPVVWAHHAATPAFGSNLPWLAI